MVESDTARVSDLPMVESDTVRVSVLPVAGCKFPAVFLGKVALDVLGLGVGPLCLRVDCAQYCAQYRYGTDGCSRSGT